MPRGLLFLFVFVSAISASGDTPPSPQTPPTPTKPIVTPAPRESKPADQVKEDWLENLERAFEENARTAKALNELHAKLLAQFEREMKIERDAMLEKLKKRSPETRDAVCGGIAPKFIKQLAALRPPPVELVPQILEEIVAERGLMTKVELNVDEAVLECVKKRRNAVIEALEDAVTEILANATKEARKATLTKLTPAQNKTLVAAMKAVQERSALNKLIREVENASPLPAVPPSPKPRIGETPGRPPVGTSPGGPSRRRGTPPQNPSHGDSDRRF